MAKKNSRQDRINVPARTLNRRGRFRSVSKEIAAATEYEYMILCIVTIGLAGFILDRLMSLVEVKFESA
jgi:hypothetical protein